MANTNAKTLRFRRNVNEPLRAPDVTFIDLTLYEIF